MVGEGDDIVRVCSLVMLPCRVLGRQYRSRRVARSLPVKRQVVTRSHLDRVFDLLVPENIAPDIDRVHVLYRGVGVAPGRRAIVSGGPDAFESALVDAVDKNSLESRLDTSDPVPTIFDRLRSSPTQM